eukprot:366115-Chlamydomonas_euryale.AAC.4
MCTRAGSRSLSIECKPSLPCCTGCRARVHDPGPSRSAHACTPRSMQGGMHASGTFMAACTQPHVHGSVHAAARSWHQTCLRAWRSMHA